MAIVVAFLTKLVAMQVWHLVVIGLGGWILGEVRWLLWQAILSYWNHLLGRKQMVPMVHRQPAIWVSARTAELMRLHPTKESAKHPIN